MACAVRSLSGGFLWAASCRGGRGDHGWPRLDPKLRCRFARDAVRRGHYRRHRCGHRIRHRQRRSTEVVSGPSRLGCGSHGRWIRRRVGIDHHPDRQPDQGERISVGILYLGILQGAVVLACAFLMRAPQKQDFAGVAVPVESQTTQDFTPLEMLKTPAFYLLYVMMTMLAMGGLMATAQLGPIAKDFQVADNPVSL